MRARQTVVIWIFLGDFDVPARHQVTCRLFSVELKLRYLCEMLARDLFGDCRSNASCCLPSTHKVAKPEISKGGNDKHLIR